MRWPGLLVAASIGALALTPYVATQAQAATCAHAQGPFTEHAAQIYQADGSRYIPYGVTVSGLERSDWANFISEDDAEIQAAATTWCANTIRFQVSEYYVNHDSKLLAEMKNEISLAESLGMVAVINDNPEWDPNRPPMPTSVTETFWRTVATMYANDPQVAFDVYNEPRGSWDCWLNGGNYCTNSNSIGMKAIATLIRSRAPNSLLWIDCQNQGTTCAGLTSHWPSIKDPVEFSIHHPDGAHNSTNWWAQFGFLVKRHIAAMVDGEWTNWATTRGECWPDAITAVPRYLQYLSHLNMGMTVWEITPGVLTAGNPSTPTVIKSNWACRAGMNESAGQLIQAWYQQHN
jgi:hypothetical protein